MKESQFLGEVLLFELIQELWVNFLSRVLLRVPFNFVLWDVCKTRSSCFLRMDLLFVLSTLNWVLQDLVGF